MNIVLTGSSGFIGHRLLEKLARNKRNNILNLVRSKPKKIRKKNITYLKCDLKNLELKKSEIIKFKPEILIHLAWDKIPKFTKKNSEQNLKTSCQLIDFIGKNTNINNVIISGSCFELYPPNKSYKYFIEAKKKIFNFIKLKSKFYNFNFQWLRIFYVFGPNQRKNALIPYLIDTIDTDNKLNIKTINFRHDYIYIDDLCNCIIKCLNKNIGSNIFEVGSGKTVNIKNILKIIENVKKTKFLLKNKTNTKKNKKFVAKIDNLKNKVGWQPKISISDGIKKIIKL